jgi:hypothetical protein
MNTKNTYAVQEKQIPTQNQQFPAQNQQFPAQNQQFPAQNQQFPQNHGPLLQTEIYSEKDTPGDHQSYLEKRVELPHCINKYELFQRDTPEGRQTVFQKTEIPKNIPAEQQDYLPAEQKPAEQDYLPGEQSYHGKKTDVPAEIGYDVKSHIPKEHKAHLPGEHKAHLSGEKGKNKKGRRAGEKGDKYEEIDFEGLPGGGFEHKEVEIEKVLPGGTVERKHEEIDSERVPGGKGYERKEIVYERLPGEQGHEKNRNKISGGDNFSSGDNYSGGDSISSGDNLSRQFNISGGDSFSGGEGYELQDTLPEEKGHNPKARLQEIGSDIKSHLPGEKNKDKVSGEKRYEDRAHLPPGDKGYEKKVKKLSGEHKHKHKARLSGGEKVYETSELEEDIRGPAGYGLAGNGVPVLPPGPEEYKIPENVANVSRQNPRNQGDILKEKEYTVADPIQDKNRTRGEVIKEEKKANVPTEHNLNVRRPHTPGEHTIPSLKKAKGSNISGDQVESRRRAAQDALKQLQMVVGEGQGGFPGTDTLTSAMQKAEDILQKEIQANDLDPETKKTLEDLALLVGSARQLIKHKDIGDRVQRITEETKKAMEEVNLPGLSGPAREATQQALQFSQNWRPLIQLLTSSREFRVLIVDSIQILRRVFLRHGEGVGESIQNRFIEGENPLNIARTATQDTATTFQNDQGETRVDVTEEEWKGLQDDITRVMATLCQHPSYHKVIEGLFDMVEVLRGQLRQAPQHVTPAAPHAHRARMETEELIADFSGRETLDEFTESYKALAARLDQNERPRQYLTEVREFILSTKSPEYIQSQEFRNRIRQLTNEAQQIAGDAVYTEELSNFLDCAEQLLYNIRNDEFMQILRHHAGLVVDDLSYVDNQGKVQIDTDMLGKLQGVLIPILADTLKYIPVPRIESDDANREFWVDNIVLCGYDIIPDNIRVQLETDSDINIRQVETKRAHTRLIVTLSQIRVEVKDIDFYYKKKKFPEMSDAGRVTVRIGGSRGATLALNFRVSQTETDPIPRFRKGTASFDIQLLEIEFDKRTIHHNVLLPVVSKLFKSQIKRQVETEVEKSLNKLVNSLGERLTEALLQVNRPLMARLDQVRDVIKSTEFAQTFEKRQQKLE